MLPILAVDPVNHVVWHHLFGWGHGHGFYPTNHMLMVLVAGLLMYWIFPRLFEHATAEPPTGVRNFFESILEFLRIEVIRPALKEHTDRFVPFLWTLFFFILFCNLLGLIPFATFFELITGGRVEHLGGTATGNIMVTAALALCAFFFIHVNGVMQVAQALMDGSYGHHAHHEEHSSGGETGHEAAHDLDHMRGDALPADVPNQFAAIADPTHHYSDDEHLSHASHGAIAHAAVQPGTRMTPGAAWGWAVPLYLWNFAPHPFKPGPGQSPLMWAPDIFMWFVLLILELLGAVIKPFALMIRLFANMIAGHIVLAVLIGLIPVTAGAAVMFGVGLPVTLLSLLVYVLEVFVAFLQAYIFLFLTTLFIASAVAPEH